MYTKVLLRPNIDDLIRTAEAEGIDLSSDTLELTFTYPDIPHILVSIRVGGLFGMEVDLDENEESYLN